MHAASSGATVDAAEGAAPAFVAVALQSQCRSLAQCASRDDARAQMSAALQRIGEQVAATADFLGADARLFVLPEYALTGYPAGRAAKHWAEWAALEPAGPELEALGQIAAQRRIFLACNAYESDAHFGGLHFQACLLFGPGGDVLLRYRRLISLYAAGPWDVWERYLDCYGLAGVFPVSHCELGALAPLASEEVLYPEIARCFALRGAEVFCHSTSEIGSPLATQKEIAQRARAIENLAFVVSANSAGVVGAGVPPQSTDGGSRVIDPQGRVLAEAGPGESMAANAELDLGALRRARRRPGMGNLPSRLPLELFRLGYAERSGQPPNSLLRGGQVIAPDREFFRRRQAAAIARLADANRGAPGDCR